MSTLRERCRKFLTDHVGLIGNLSDDVDDLMAFVLAEKGRDAVPTGKDVAPVVLFCDDEESRELVVDAFKAMRGVKSKKMP